MAVTVEMMRFHILSWAVRTTTKNCSASLYDHLKKENFHYPAVQKCSKIGTCSYRIYRKHHLSTFCVSKHIYKLYTCASALYFKSWCHGVPFVKRTVQAVYRTIKPSILSSRPTGLHSEGRGLYCTVLQSWYLSNFTVGQFPGQQEQISALPSSFYPFTMLYKISDNTDFCQVLIVALCN